MARSNNMKMLNEDALDKVGAGITSLEEVMRVVPFEHTAATLRCIACSKVLAPTFSFCPYCGTSARGVTNAVAVTTA
jgi:rRNA maturation endonuclease Nob1